MNAADAQLNLLRQQRSLAVALSGYDPTADLAGLDEQANALGSQLSATQQALAANEARIQELMDQAKDKESQTQALAEREFEIFGNRFMGVRRPADLAAEHFESQLPFRRCPLSLDCAGDRRLQSVEHDRTRPKAIERSAAAKRIRDLARNLAPVDGGTKIVKAPEGRRGLPASRFEDRFGRAPSHVLDRC